MLSEDRSIPISSGSIFKARSITAFLRRSALRREMHLARGHFSGLRSGFASFIVHIAFGPLEKIAEMPVAAAKRVFSIVVDMSYLLVTACGNWTGKGNYRMKVFNRGAVTAKKTCVSTLLRAPISLLTMSWRKNSHYPSWNASRASS